MKLFGKSKKNEAEENLNQESSNDTLEGFEESLDNTLREEKTQIIAAKTEESRAKAMVRTLLDAGYSINEVNSFIGAGKSFDLKGGQININQ